MFKKIKASLEKQIYNSLGFIWLLTVMTRFSYLTVRAVRAIEPTDPEYIPKAIEAIVLMQLAAWIHVIIGFVVITGLRTYNHVRHGLNN